MLTVEILIWNHHIDPTFNVKNGSPTSTSRISEGSSFQKRFLFDTCFASEIVTVGLIYILINGAAFMHFQPWLFEFLQN